MQWPSLLRRKTHLTPRGGVLAGRVAKAGALAKNLATCSYSGMPVHAPLTLKQSLTGVAHWVAHYVCVGHTSVENDMVNLSM